MRGILFKGKRADNGEWVEGAFLQSDDECRIVTSYLRESDEKDPVITVTYIVDPETVSQYTGLKDKNGVDIWENDLLRYSYEYPGSPWLAQKGMTDDDIRYDVGAVFWQEWRGSWAVCGWGKSRMMNSDVFTYCRNPNRTEVIGNIFDNPELIEG